MTPQNAAPDTPDSAALHARIRDSFDRSGLMRQLGARLGDVARAGSTSTCPTAPT